MSSIEKQIGVKITEIRLSQRLTQSQLAEKVGVSVETISRLERGITIPSLKTIERIADSLKTPLKSFFEFDDLPRKNQPFERKLAKLTVFLRTLNRKELALVHEVLKLIFKKVRSNTAAKHIV